MGTVAAFGEMILEFHAANQIELVIEIRVQQVALRVVIHASPPHAAGRRSTAAGCCARARVSTSPFPAETGSPLQFLCMTSVPIPAAKSLRETPQADFRWRVAPAPRSPGAGIPTPA